MKKINFKLTDGLDTWKFTIDDENVEVICGAEAFENFKSICRILGSWVSLNHPQNVVPIAERCQYFPKRIEQGCQNPTGPCPPSDHSCFLNNPAMDKLVEYLNKSENRVLELENEKRYREKLADEWRE